jgi:hypothetical protein
MRLLLLGLPEMRLLLLGLPEMKHSIEALLC